MATIETFDFDKLKISSIDGMDRKMYKEIRFDYDGGKPVFKVDGNIYYLLYSNRWLKDDREPISVFRIKDVIQEFRDDLGCIDEVRVGKCFIDGVPNDEYHYGSSFTGSCEIEIEKVVFYEDDESGLFSYVILQTKIVEVDKLIWDGWYELERRLDEEGRKRIVDEVVPSVEGLRRKIGVIDPPIME